eukprot:CAMPEP_0194767080 /NCGR_PEP_ID=MMETSP0323_2-20130528/34423_1 /TAXON_ID=2866 ORGANISM="Crypthecodinium cohnii, Strain Seligo" /NCGR_SAMPLE_ID=MMETSP0323_2 /ASSEMBLY_ACC=CAM_ASM_000346 /LENGTH=53 /DNA_ID=CAMNT_0039698533 /DNA_START=294 /DNA_END=451 /DNA_ORIENTATION=-
MTEMIGASSPRTAMAPVMACSGKARDATACRMAEKPNLGCSLLRCLAANNKMS